MRNAAAHFDDDFDLTEPPRKKTARRGVRNGKRQRRFRLNVDFRRISRYTAIGLAALVGVGIIVNALALQKGHHPAPLFGSTTIAPPVPTPPVRTVMATPPPRPAVALSVPSPEVPTVAVPAPREKPEAPHAQSRPAGGDPIARLLASGAGTAAERPSVKTVFGVQRALVKLGFVLKPNGVLGPQTKKALELFEKDRHLPITADVDRRLLRTLVAESGLKIEH